MDIIRHAVLGYINALHKQIKNLKDSVAFHQELAAREFWTVTKLLPLVADSQAKEQVMIEREVNTMDQDFNFSKVIFGEETQPKKPLCISATP